MNKSGKETISSALNYSPIGTTIPASVKEEYYNPVGNNVFSYSTVQTINIKVASVSDNAFCNFKHSYIQCEVVNPNPFPIFFDKFGSSIIQDFNVKVNNVDCCLIQDYNVLMNSLLSHFGSASFSKELGITSAGMVAPLVASTKTDGSAGHNKVLDTTATIATTIYGNNMIPANGGSVIVSIPIVCGFLTTKLLPILFLQNSFTEINLRLADPKVAFIAPNTITNAQNLAMDYQVKNCRLVCEVISLKDEKKVAELTQLLMRDGLYINTHDYVRYKHTISESDNDDINLTINDRSQSLRNIWQVSCLSTPDARYSNLRGGIYGQNSFRLQCGSDYMPYNDAIRFGPTNMLQSYLNLQKVAGSGGYYSTNNHCDIDLISYMNQSSNSVFDFGSIGQMNGATALANHALNQVSDSSFVYCFSFQTFSSLDGSAETGLNVAVRNLPLNLIITRKNANYTGIEAMRYADGALPDVTVGAGGSSYPLLNSYTYCCYDVCYHILSTGQVMVYK